MSIIKNHFSPSGVMVDITIFYIYVIAYPVLDKCKDWNIVKGLLYMMYAASSVHM